MNTTNVRQLAVAAALSLASLATQGAWAAESTAPTQAPQPTSAATTTASAAGQTGLTRAQVLEDLKRYQREHANPSYAELVFMR